eukprot:scaffold45999_cov63-Phaeocystis_antarctica.AAC.6
MPPSCTVWSLVPTAESDILGSASRDVCGDAKGCYGRGAMVEGCYKQGLLPSRFSRASPWATLVTCAYCGVLEATAFRGGCDDADADV